MKFRRRKPMDEPERGTEVEAAVPQPRSNRNINDKFYKQAELVVDEVLRNPPKKRDILDAKPARSFKAQQRDYIWERFLESAMKYVNEDYAGASGNMAREDMIGLVADQKQMEASADADK